MLRSALVWRAAALLLFLIGLGLIGVRWYMLREPIAPAGQAFTAAAPASQSPIAAAFGDGAQDQGDDLPAGLPPGVVFAQAGDWQDADGRSVTLAELRGRPAVVTFIYSTCADACPLVLAMMDRAMAQLPPAVRDGTTRLALSFDPARDSPRALAGMRDRLRLDPARWRFLTPRRKSALDAVTPLFGFVYFATGADFAHTTLVGVVNADGRVTARISRDLDDAGALASHLRRALVH